MACSPCALRSNYMSFVAGIRYRPIPPIFGSRHHGSSNSSSVMSSGCFSLAGINESSLDTVSRLLGRANAHFNLLFDRCFPRHGGTSNWLNLSSAIDVRGHTIIHRKLGLTTSTLH